MGQTGRRGEDKEGEDGGEKRKGGEENGEEGRGNKGGGGEKMGNKLGKHKLKTYVRNTCS